MPRNGVKLMVDLNCDLGESFGRWTLGDDTAIMPLITSANIACGFHAGDPSVIAASIKLAKRAGVAIGAHPGYPDLQGFGRRYIPLRPDEVEAVMLYQIGAVYALTRAAGADLVHVKPHGALYNHAWANVPTAQAIARAVHAFSRDLILVAQAGSALAGAGEELGLVVAREAFADRAYAVDGSLLPRGSPRSVLDNGDDVVRQALDIVCHDRVNTPDGPISVRADTLCVHGDTPGAVGHASRIRDAMADAGVTVRALQQVVGERGPELSSGGDSA